MTNRLYTGDNLHFLHRFDSESVDLIYLDPPFNSKRTYSAPIGSKAAGSSFKDMWTWHDIDEQLLETLLTKHPKLGRFIKSVEDIHGKAMMAYVLYVAVRIVEMHRVLKNTGSLYLHCDPTACHYLKLVLDEIFGCDHFRNEIIWGYRTGGVSKAWFPRKHDTILCYGKTDTNKKMTTHNPLKERIDYSTNFMGTCQQDKNGQWYADVYLRDVWDSDEIKALINTSSERTGYPTQKPLKLLHRIIKASSTEGDVVLDPFCGCATTCVAAQQLKRKWIAIDIEKQAAGLLTQRLKQADLSSDFIHTHELPTRTDIRIETDSKSMREKLYTSQKGKCNICGAEFEPRHFELDHIIPKSKGGSDTESNYQLLCASCNRIKGTKPMEYLRMRIAQIDQALATQITFGR